MSARFLAFCCSALLALPAHAFLSDSDARKQIADLRAETNQTIDGLRQRLDNAGKNQLGLANQIEAMRADLARITGQIELLTHSLDAAHKRQQDFYVDLDNRLRKLETASAAPAPTAAEPTAKVDPQAEMRDYEAALALFRTAKYKESQAAFESFVAAYPKAGLLPNAHYWLGSSLYQQKQFAKAIEAYGKVPASWPNDAKAPDALFGRANAQVEAKDVKGAIDTLELLVQKYPNSPVAESARSRLKTLAPKKQR